MIPSAKELSEIARRREGSLAEVPFPTLLRALSHAGRSAVLKLSRGPLEKNIVFDAGVPVDCESNLLHESLGRVLVQQKKIREEDYQRALATSAAQDKSLAEVLLAQQLIASFDLFRVMQQSLAHKLLDVFAWRDGQFRVLADAPEVESPLRVNVGQLVVTGVVRVTPQAQVDAFIVSLVGKPLGVHPSPPTSLASLRLNTKHSRALQVLKTKPRLDELMAKAGLAPDEVTRLVYALAVLGIVAPVDELPAEPVAAAPPPPSGPAPAQATAPASISADDALLLDAVMTLYMRRRRGDAFDLLAIPITADAAAITSAYLKASELVAPWRFKSPALAQVAEKAEELYLALARAYAELIDGEARGRLLERRRQTAQGPFKPRPDAFAIKTKLLDASAQFAEGMAHKEAGRYAQALPLLEFAADCDAQNATYKAEAAHCRFLDAPNTQSKRALGELEEAMRMDPLCALPAYYAAQVHLAAGEVGKARRELKHALRLAPDDARYRAALRDLG
jgi:hypothetical protein